MNCEVAREQLLEVDLPVLRGEGGGALAEHLHGCPACRDRARRILHQTAALTAALGRVAPRHARAPAAWRTPGARRLPLRRWAAVIPLALAASLAVLLLSRRSPGPTVVSGPSSQTELASASLDVQVPPGQTFTVFQTDNPNIVVVWSF